MEKITRLSWEFSLYPLIPENAEYFWKNVRIEDIFSNWKKSWQCSIEEVREHTAYYVNHLCNPKAQELVWGKHKEAYGVTGVDDYGVVRGSTWIGNISHRHFRSKVGERQLGNYGIELFETFRSQWLGTLLTAQWIHYLQRVTGISGISASCNVNNIKSKRMLQKLGLHTPKYDYRDEETGSDCLAFYLYKSNIAD